jgi:hypothetical protein
MDKAGKRALLERSALAAREATHLRPFLQGDLRLALLRKGRKERESGWRGAGAGKHTLRGRWQQREGRCPRTSSAKTPAAHWRTHLAGKAGCVPRLAVRLHLGVSGVCEGERGFTGLLRGLRARRARRMTQLQLTDRLRAHGALGAAAVRRHGAWEETSQIRRPYPPQTGCSFRICKRNREKTKTFIYCVILRTYLRYLPPLHAGFVVR